MRCEIDPVPCDPSTGSASQHERRWLGLLSYRGTLPYLTLHSSEPNPARRDDTDRPLFSLIIINKVIAVVPSSSSSSPPPQQTRSFLSSFEITASRLRAFEPTLSLPPLETRLHPAAPALPLVLSPLRPPPPPSSMSSGGSDIKLPLYNEEAESSKGLLGENGGGRNATSVKEPPKKMWPGESSSRCVPAVKGHPGTA